MKKIKRKATLIVLCNKAVPKDADCNIQVFLHTLFLEYATEMRGNKCKAVFYRYKQIGMQSLELFWPFSILAKNLGDVVARGLSVDIMSNSFNEISTIKKSHSKIYSVHVNQTIKILINYQFLLVLFVFF